ncbi:MAG: stage II sporulation protein M [Erysipelotrichaceae bacterium]
MKGWKHYNGFLKKYKNVYIFLTILMISGFISGIIFSQYIDLTDIKEFASYLTTMNQGIDKYRYFVHQFLLGILYCLGVFIIGTSLLGIPIIAFLAFSKGLQIGFSCALFVYTYQLKGLVGIILTLLPQVLLDLASTFLISAAAIQLSMYIVYSCSNLEKLNFKKLANSILNDIFISFVIVLIAAYLKSTIVIELIKIFNLM